MRHSSFLLSLFLVVFGLTAAGQNTAVKAAPKPEADTPAATQLPVTRVSLYKNGVGFFEHSGRVTGSQSVTIDFTTAQLNDVLQSLTAIDLGGGRIVGAGYNSTTPLEQQLKALPLALGEDPTAVDFYNAIRGARVEVHAGAETAAGRLLKIEVLDSGAQEVRLITVISDGGEVRTLSLTPTTSVQLLDTDLHKDVTRYLELLASSRNEGLRHLTLEDNAPAGGGGGSRELRVSYISEVPVWKSTYRILFSDSKTGGPQPATLQGWSVVDNTTGEDWMNVQLSLIAGAPQSFIQPLSQPIYSRRPEIAIAEEAQFTPQTHESGELMGGALSAAGGGIRGTLTDPTGAVIANATVSATNVATNSVVTRTTNARGEFAIGPLPAGQYRVEVNSPGFQRLIEDGVTVNGAQTAALNLRLNVGSTSETVTVTAAPPMLNTSEATLGGTIGNETYSALSIAKARKPTDFQYLMPGVQYEQAASSSTVAASTGAAFDDYFAYNLTEPITIRKNESALVPILQTKIDAERVTLWSGLQQAGQQPVPLRALWITNTSNLTLDRGSFSIVEDGNFGGEGLLDPIHPKEKRLLSYAVDQAVRVTTEGDTIPNKVTSITVAKGVLILRSTQAVQVTYVVRNAAPDARTVVIEHPVRAGYVLDAGLKPAETTPDAYRFRVAAPAGETVRLKVGETVPGEARFELTDSDEDQLAVIVNETGHNPGLVVALQPVIAARRAEADAEDAVDKINKRLAALQSDEGRQRSNVTALASADKASRERFVHDLNVTEDAIAAAQKELATAQAAQEAAEDDLEKKIEAVQLEEKL
ncbi:MAG: carboxypeptidase regulatory-like domain-containing protein [Acidobacteriaceae bacterium]|jgi:hypothetical protein